MSKTCGIDFVFSSSLKLPQTEFRVGLSLLALFGRQTSCITPITCLVFTILRLFIEFCTLHVGASVHLMNQVLTV